MVSTDGLHCRRVKGNGFMRSLESQAGARTSGGVYATFRSLEVETNGKLLKGLGGGVTDETCIVQEIRLSTVWAKWILANRVEPLQSSTKLMAPCMSVLWLERSEVSKCLHFRFKLRRM